MIPVKHILVAIDFGLASTRALEVATKLAMAFDAKLTVLHAIEEPPNGLPCPPELRRSAEFRLKETVAPLHRHLSKVEGNLREGFAWREITEAAAQIGADLVVVGSHGRGHDARFRIGSVAERVLRVCPVPVLTVRGWRFDSRPAAGRELAELLLRSHEQRPTVVALSRGGLLVGAEVAEAFGAPLRVLLTRALERDGCPFGAVCEDGTVHVSSQQDAADGERIRAQASRACAELRDEMAAMRVPRWVPNGESGSVFLVSDSILDPGPAMVAARAVRRGTPCRLMATAPVASVGSIRVLKADVDAVLAVQIVEDGLPLDAIYRDLSLPNDPVLAHRLAAADEWSRAVEKKP